MASNPPPVQVPGIPGSVGPVPGSSDAELEVKYNNNEVNDGSSSPASPATDAAEPPVDIAIVNSRVDGSPSSCLGMLHPPCSNPNRPPLHLHLHLLQ